MQMHVQARQIQACYKGRQVDDKYFKGVPGVVKGVVDGEGEGVLRFAGDAGQRVAAKPTAGSAAGTGCHNHCLRPLCTAKQEQVCVRGSLCHLEHISSTSLSVTRQSEPACCCNGIFTMQIGLAISNDWKCG